MADSYTQSLLADGETIKFEARQHWVALIRFAIQPIVLLIVALVCLAIGIWLTPDGTGLFNDIVRWTDTLLGLATAGLFILAVVWLPVQAYRWVRRRFLVTDRRVVYVEGVLRRTSVDAGLNMITDVGFRQPLFGRKLGYGDLVVATASNRPLHFRQMRDAMAFKKAIMDAQQATIQARADQILEQGGHAPAAAAVAVTAPAATAAPAAVAVVPAATGSAATPAATPTEAPVLEPVWDGTDVPQMAEDDVPAYEPSIFGSHVDPEPATPETVVGAGPDVDVAAVVADAEPAMDPSPVSGAASAIGEAGAAADILADDTQADPDGEPEPEILADATDAVDLTDAEPAAAVADAIETPAAPSGGYMDAIAAADASIAGTSTTNGPMGAQAITDAIAQLATLRDAGSITDADFEAKKQDLLSRL